MQNSSIKRFYCCFYCKTYFAEFWATARQTESEWKRGGKEKRKIFKLFYLALSCDVNCSQSTPFLAQMLLPPRRQRKYYRAMSKSNEYYYYFVLLFFFCRSKCEGRIRTCHYDKYYGGWGYISKDETDKISFLIILQRITNGKIIFFCSFAISSLLFMIK